jgi:5-(carboxyamino)imidazole ribonucleotide synthase
VITFDHEHVPPAVLAALVADGVAVRPAPEALVAAQDKIAMRERLAALGVPIPAWTAAREVATIAEFLAAHGGVAVAKTPTGGYDGKGVRVVRAAEEVGDWLDRGPVLLEELVPFRRELAQLVARRPSGEVRAWPLAETVQRDGVCAEVTVPAPESEGLAGSARGIAETVAAALDVVGVLAVELFETEDGRILVNELAMRPHNSGHWSIDGSITSQFEQHLRAVLDLPLGDPAPRQPWSVMVNVLGGPVGATMPDRYSEQFAALPDVKAHSYGKASRPGRKVGHVTAVGNDLADVRRRARAAAAFYEA